MGFLIAYFLLRRARSGRIGLLSIDILFLLLYSVTMLGYILLYSLGLARWSSEVVIYPEAFGESIAVVFLGMIAFIVAYNVVLETVVKSTARKAAPSETEVWFRHGFWGRIGEVLFILGLVSHVAALAIIGPVAIRQFGYAAIQNPQRYAGSRAPSFMLALGGICLLLGVAYLVASSALFTRSKLFGRSRMRWAWAASCLLLLLEGDRGGLMLLILPVALGYHYLMRPLRATQILAGSMVVVVTFSVISEVRSSALDLDRMGEEFQQSRMEDDITLYSFVPELGSSFNSINAVVQDVPRYESYWRGGSWFDSVVHVIPGLQGLLFRSSARQSPSAWFTETYFGQYRSGRAFSLVAEGYLNWGVFGVIVELGAMGLLCGWIALALRKSDIGQVALGLVALTLVLLSVRNHLNVLIAPLAQSAILTLVLSKLAGSARQGRTRSVEYRKLSKSSSKRGRSAGRDL